MDDWLEAGAVAAVAVGAVVAFVLLVVGAHRAPRVTLLLTALLGLGGMWAMAQHP